MYARHVGTLWGTQEILSNKFYQTKTGNIFYFCFLFLYGLRNIPLHTICLLVISKSRSTSLFHSLLFKISLCCCSKLHCLKYGGVSICACICSLFQIKINCSRLMKFRTYYPSAYYQTIFLKKSLYDRQHLKPGQNFLLTVICWNLRDHPVF